MTESIEQVAARRLEAEEEKRREARLRELAAEEEQRREQEARERERLEAIERAREEANLLGAEQGLLADELDRRLDDLDQTAAEYLDMAEKRWRILSAAGLLPVGVPAPRPILRQHISSRVDSLSRSEATPPTGHDARTLRERDPLTPS